MREQQKLQTPLVESNLRLEPPTLPSMPVIERIQRSWSMLFGRRENTLQPIYASRAGMLGVVGCDLNGWRMAYNAVPTENTWTDMGEVVDFIMYNGLDNGDAAPYLELGMVTGTVLQVHLPQSYIYFAETPVIGQALSGLVHVRARWFRGVNLFAMAAHVVGYVAPER